VERRFDVAPSMVELQELFALEIVVAEHPHPLCRLASIGY
jgi:hypothetical protein